MRDDMRNFQICRFFLLILELIDHHHLLHHHQKHYSDVQLHWSQTGARSHICTDLVQDSVSSEKRGVEVSSMIIAILASTLAPGSNGLYGRKA